MATLGNDDFKRILAWAWRQPTTRSELKGWSLSKPVFQAAMQAIEDYMVNAFGTTPTTSIRAAIEAVTGATTSQRAQALFACWVAWKLDSYLGV